MPYCFIYRSVRGVTPARPHKMCVAATVLVAAVTASTAVSAQVQAPTTDAEILALMKIHHVACHAVEPTYVAFAQAPAGILLETVPQVAGKAARIITQAVVTRAMPLGNATQMTDDDRERIPAWSEGRHK